MKVKDSPYIFRASEAELVEESATLKMKEAQMADGMTVRYQERSPGGAPDGPWCETGHSAYIVSGRLRYEFPDHEVEIGPGDIVHIPAGYAHRHRPQAIGDEPVKYFITEFS
ncbi:MAG: cupin domain-containing protein [Alphaproteobacteria bacterium]|nr:cupin domain-containing protein [Alphaproteobacteria bacterium]